MLSHNSLRSLGREKGKRETERETEREARIGGPLEVARIERLFSIDVHYSISYPNSPISGILHSTSRATVPLVAPRPSGQAIQEVASPPGE